MTTLAKQKKIGPEDSFSIDSHKMHYHLDRVNEWFSGKKESVFPIYVEISPVGHCNHRCTFCAVDYIGYKARKLETTRLKEVLGDMAEKGVRSVMFAGEGEPLLHKDLSEIINAAASFGMDVAITTNGVFLNEDFVDACLSNITWIKVSCNAGTAETYAKVHQTKATDFDRVWTNLRYAASKKGTKTAIGVQSVLLPENGQEMETLAHLGKAAGLDYLVVKPYSQHLKSLTRTYEAIAYEKEIPDWIFEVSDNSFEVIWRSQAMEVHEEKTRAYQKCYSTPFFWAYIMADGDVYGCSAYLEDERFCYGNIHEALFSEIWLGEKRKQAIDFVENELDIKECRQNCRMDKVNRWLWDIQNPKQHKNFI